MLKGLTNNEAFKTQQNKIQNTYTHAYILYIKNNSKNTTQRIHTELERYQAKRV